MSEDKIIAQWLKAHWRESLGYAASPTCPQGHDSQIAQKHPIYDHDYWVNDSEWELGVICLSCIVNGAEGLDRNLSGNAYYDYDAAKDIRRQYQNGLTYPPEWRVEAVPHDFTNPAHLIPAVEAFCDETGMGFRFDTGGTPLLWRYALAAAIVGALNPFSPHANDGENDEKGEH